MLSRRSTLVMGLLSAVLALGATPAHADAYGDTIDAFRKADASGKFFSTAHGWAVFPTIGKGGVGVGGAYGKGRVYQRGKVIGDVTMTQVTVGFQLGGQGYSQIVFFEDEKALNTFIADEYQFGAEVAAVVINAGASAKLGTTGATAGGNVADEKSKVVGKYQNGMAVFTLVKGGAMYEATLGGQKFKFSRR